MTDLTSDARRLRGGPRPAAAGRRPARRDRRGSRRPAWPPGPRRGWPVRFVRGKESDAAWVRPALLALLVATAVLYLWDLGASGWANSFYSAAVQAGTKSWKALFFGSSDSSNFITVDKPPAFLWPMEISARIFGLNSWSMLVPQALEGVATVGLVYLSVRRWFSAQAALLGGAVVALTPVAAMMFRYNNPDALLALLLTAATYATMRGLEKAQTKWLVLAGALVGFGFITKMMQAFLILPVMAVVYLLAAPTGWWRRVWQIFLMGVSVLVAAGWWVAIVALTPAADRPYVGGSQNNSILNLIFGYNGFGRLNGNESGSVGGGPGRREHVGPDRLDPAVQRHVREHDVVAAARRAGDGRRAARRHPPGPSHRPRTRRAAAVGRLAGLHRPRHQPGARASSTPTTPSPSRRRSARWSGIATMGLWQRRATWVGRVGLAAGLAATVVWSYVLLGRTSDWFPALRPFVAVVGVLGVVAILALPLLRTVPKLAIVLVAVLGLGAALAAPLFSTVATAATPHNGAIPSVTPTPAGGVGGPGGGFPGAASPAAAVLAAHFAGPSAAAHSPAARGAAASPAAAASLVPGASPLAPAPAPAPGRARAPCRAVRRRRRVPSRGRGWRWWCGVLELQPVQPRTDQGAAGRRQPLHLGRGHGELEQRGRLPAGERRTGHGDRRLQRHRPCAHAGPVRAVRLGGQDPLLHRQRGGGFGGGGFGGGGDRRRRVADHVVGGVALHRRDGGRGDHLQPDQRRLVLSAQRPRAAPSCAGGIQPSSSR